MESSINGGERLDGLFFSDTDGTDVDSDGSVGDAGDEGDSGKGIMAATLSSLVAPPFSVVA